MGNAEVLRQQDYLEGYSHDSYKEILGCAREQYNMIDSSILSYSSAAYFT